jgi:hypothetical protein
MTRGVAPRRRLARHGERAEHELSLLLPVVENQQR